MDCVCLQNIPVLILQANDSNSQYIDFKDNKSASTFLYFITTAFDIKHSIHQYKQANNNI